MLFGMALALVASVAHATWNTVVKRVSAGGLAALWAYSFGAAVLIALATAGAAAAGYPLRITPRLVLVAAGSTVLHTTYAALTQNAYKHFDLSDVYPISRGVAPIAVAFAGSIAFHQTLCMFEWSGLLCMTIAIGLLLRGHRRPSPEIRITQPTLAGLTIAGSIAAYTTYDGWAIVDLNVTPLAYCAVGAAFQLALVTVLIKGRTDTGCAQLQRHLAPIVALSMLIPGSYLLALYANEHAPVSVVAAIRSSSLIWAAIAAPIALREPLKARRLAATVLAVAALVAMAL
jgi:drug/metabolite transporter (DMT)-like permease